MQQSAIPMASMEYSFNDTFDDKPYQEQHKVPKQHQSILRNKVILSILVTETAERVAYFGFRAVLVLYFTNGLEFSESTSVSLFASVSALAYLSPLVGALLADSSWGRYRTIWRFGIVYSIGLCLVTLGAYQLGPPLSISCPISMDVNSNDCGDISNELNNSRGITQENLFVARSLSFVGLILVCLGTGGIKPCVSAFGADQVVLADCHVMRRECETTSSTQIYSNVGDEDLSDLVLEDKNSVMESLSATKAKPSISTERSIDENKEDRVREFFNSFYFCINVGALLSFAIIPMVRANYGFGAAFFIPTMFMIGALGIFISQRKVYKHRKRDPSQPLLFKTLHLCLKILFPKRCGNYRRIDDYMTESSDIDVRLSTVKCPHGVVEDKQSGPAISSKKEVTAESEIDVSNSRVRRDAEQVLHLMPLMLFFPVFWMLYDQQGSVWTLQATRLNRHGLEPEQTGFLNPLEIMLFIPLFDQILYPWLEAKGFNIHPLRRMEYGMFLTSIAFFTSTLLEYSIQEGPPNSISLAWQIPQITILTVAEILLNVTGLEFAYSQAPDSMQAIILAIFLFMTAIGDGFGSVLFATIFRELSSSVTMVTCAVCMLVNLALFSRVARHWKPYRTHSGNERHDVDHRENSGDEEGVQLNMLANNGIIS